MKEGDAIIKKGQVEQVYDESEGLRIKVRLPQDGNMPLKDSNSISVITDIPIALCK